MPGLEFLEATRRLRASGLNRQAPVIVFSGAVLALEMEVCRSAAMKGMIEKPVVASDLDVALFGEADD